MSLTEEKITEIFLRLRDAAGLPKTTLNPRADTFENNAHGLQLGFNRSKINFDMKTAIRTHLNEKEAEAIIAHELGHAYETKYNSFNIMIGVVAVTGFVKFVSLATILSNPFLAIPAIAMYVTGCGLSGAVQRSICFGMTSHARERHADRFGTQLVGHNGMISALEKINRAKFGDIFVHTCNIKGPTHPSFNERVKIIDKTLEKMSRK